MKKLNVLIAKTAKCVRSSGLLLIGGAASFAALSQPLPPYEIVPYVRTWSGTESTLSMRAVKIDRIAGVVKNCVAVFRNGADTLRAHCEPYPHVSAASPPKTSAFAVVQAEHAHAGNVVQWLLWSVNVSTGTVTICALTKKVCAVAVEKD